MASINASLGRLKMTELPVVCNLGAKTTAETKISDVIKFPSEMASSNIDVAFLSRDRKRVCGIIEGKNKAPGVKTKEQQSNLLQLAAYMLSSQAYCQWGLGSKPRNDPIIGLLVYSTAIYRLSIMKPADSDEKPFGLSYKLEYTKDPTIYRISRAFKHVERICWDSL
uniref:Uncharacterized protein n=1 Tax=Cryptomonas curvata TaxID=233186 RepID=A0A7S0LXS7_9CRYP|mmetsp:Transcript_15441/g.32964  ORF Transcript_15441/g.32964 Transcript_15441/m.32964 type:complete len:167 (+) Transcript_15441:383-883(+)